MKIDIFCHVIDYFGDVAVSMRLAMALKKVRNDWHIRFFCDESSVIQRLFPIPDLVPGLQYEGIELYPAYQKAFGGGADVAIECLSCDLPVNYDLPPLVINWEYLTAENWASEYHGLPSFLPGGRQKYFFLPGIKKGTGGLTWGAFTHQKREIENTRSVSRKKWLEGLVLPFYDTEQRWASLYSYQIDLSVIESQKETLFFTPETNTSRSLPSNVCVCPVMPLHYYDQLVLLADYNIVRGEDSLSRAILSGRPFIWQAYKQQENAHLLKIEALLAVLRESFSDTALYTLVEKQYNDFNNSGYFEPDFFEQNRQALEQSAQYLAEKVMYLGAQEENLATFIEEKSNSTV